MAKKPTPVRAWFRTVMPGRRSCPSCGTKLPPGEEVWSLGQYVRGKWNTVTHFCRACFRVRVQGLLRPGVVYEPVGYGGQKLPTWIVRGVADPEWQDPGPYEKGSLFDPEMKNPRHLTPAQKAAFERWLAQARAKKRSNPMTRCSNPSHWHRGTHLAVRCNPASRFCVQYAGGGQAVYTTLAQALAAHRQSPGSTVYEQVDKQWVWRSNPATATWRAAGLKKVEIPADWSKSRYIRYRYADPEAFDPRSFRTKLVSKAKGVKAIIGCPRGQWDAARARCRKGTRMQALLYPYSAAAMKKAQADARAAGARIVQSQRRSKSSVFANPLSAEEVREIRVDAGHASRRAQEHVRDRLHYLAAEAFGKAKGELVVAGAHAADGKSREDAWSQLSGIEDQFSAMTRQLTDEQLGLVGRLPPKPSSRRKRGKKGNPMWMPTYMAPLANPREHVDVCDRCGTTATDIDTGFCLSLHKYGHGGGCGGTWRLKPVGGKLRGHKPGCRCVICARANPFTTKQAQEVARGAKRTMLSGMKAERHLQDRTAAYDLGRSLGYTDALRLAGPTKQVRKRSAGASMRIAHKLKAIVERDDVPPMTSCSNPKAPRAPRPRGLTSEESLALAAQAATAEDQAGQYYLTRARTAASDLGYAHGLLAPVAGYATSRDVRDAAEAVMGNVVRKSVPLKAMDRGFYQNPQRPSRYLWHSGNYCVARAGRMCALYVKVGKRWKLLGRGDTLADCKRAVARMRRSR